MKKILYSVFALAMTAFTLTSCEDVPEPYTQPATVEAINPTGNGTLEEPFNIAAVNQFIKAGVGLDQNVYIKGIVSTIDEISVSNGNATFYISDNGTILNQFYVYRCKGLNNENVTSEDIIKLGDEVIICGKVVNYNGTYETSQGAAYIYSINGNGGNGDGNPQEPPVTGNFIYNETVGSAAVSSPYPYVDTYTSWETTGTGASSVNYSGNNVTVRSSGLSNKGSYDGASGPNVVFFGTAPSEFVINKISLSSGQQNLKLSFGASYSFRNTDGSYDNTFDVSKFTVSVSADGNSWTRITYTKDNGDLETPYWIHATSDFTLAQAVSELYIKFEASVSSSIRLDDITLAEGTGGQIVNINGGAVTPPTGGIIYKESVGTASVKSPYPYVDAYESWTKEGTGAATVTYSGTKATIRATGNSNIDAYDGASGPNVIFFGTLPAEFIINKISLASGQQNLKLSFGASYSFRNTDGNYDNTFDVSKFTVSVSKDGNSWKPITYTKNNGDEKSPYWIHATSDFTLSQPVSDLYIKFEASVASVFRLDDIVLVESTGGQTVTF